MSNPMKLDCGSIVVSLIRKRIIDPTPDDFLISSEESQTNGF